MLAMVCESGLGRVDLRCATSAIRAVPRDGWDVETREPRGFATGVVLKCGIKPNQLQACVAAPRTHPASSWACCWESAGFGGKTGRWRRDAGSLCQWLASPLPPRHSHGCPGPPVLRGSADPAERQRYRRCRGLSHAPFVPLRSFRSSASAAMRRSNLTRCGSDRTPDSP